MGDPQIYVRGFPKYTTEDELRSVFGAFGDIREVRMIRDYAFIVFEGEDAVQKAVDDMNGKEINEQRVRVEIAGQPKKPKGPQPNDECRLCGRKGHWKNDCPDLRREKQVYRNKENGEEEVVHRHLHHHLRPLRASKRKSRERVMQESEEAQRKIKEAPLIVILLQQLLLLQPIQKGTQKRRQLMIHQSIQWHSHETFR